MTEFRQANGRHVEAEFRSKGPPRIPRLPERTQWPRTLTALIVILLVAAFVLIYSRF